MFTEGVAKGFGGFVSAVASIDKIAYSAMYKKEEKVKRMGKKRAKRAEVMIRRALKFVDKIDTDPKMEELVVNTLLGAISVIGNIDGLNTR